MRRQRRFVPGANGIKLEPRLPLDGDVTVAVGPQPDTDTMPLDGVLGADPPPVDYDALQAALDSTGPITGPMPSPTPANAFD